MTTTQDYMTLISAEGFEFIVPINAAKQSKYLSELLSSHSDEEEEQEQKIFSKVKLSEISTDILEMVCQYLMEKSIRGTFITNFAPLQNLDPSNENDRQIAIELLLASNYLDC
ncbi:hypothetical protein ABK040_000715 [Willaertia magna]